MFTRSPEDFFTMTADDFAIYVAVCSRTTMHSYNRAHQTDSSVMSQLAFMSQSSSIAPASHDAMAYPAHYL